MQLVEDAQARAGRGLEGDRYAARAGTFSPRAGHRPGYDLTLMAAEVLDEMAAGGQPLDLAGTRRNVLTRGLDVNAMVGRTFYLGTVLCEGRRLCEPCVHLDRLSGPGDPAAADPPRRAARRRPLRWRGPSRRADLPRLTFARQVSHRPPSEALPPAAFRGCVARPSEAGLGA